MSLQNSDDRGDDGGERQSAVRSQRKLHKANFTTQTSQRKLHKANFTNSTSRTQLWASPQAGQDDARDTRL